MTDKRNVGHFRAGTLPFQLFLIGNLKIAKEPVSKVVISVCHFARENPWENRKRQGDVGSFYTNLL